MLTICIRLCEVFSGASREALFVLVIKALPSFPNIEQAMSASTKGEESSPRPLQWIRGAVFTLTLLAHVHSPPHKPYIVTECVQRLVCFGMGEEETGVKASMRKRRSEQGPGGTCRRPQSTGAPDTLGMGLQTSVPCNSVLAILLGPVARELPY